MLILFDIKVMNSTYIYIKVNLTKLRIEVSATII